MAMATDSRRPTSGLLANGRMDRDWIDAAACPVVSTVSLRFSDLDMLGHVNNVAALQLLQEARTDFNECSGLLMVTEQWRTVVASTSVEYAEEITYPGAVEIGTGFASVGRTSFTFAQIARQNGRPVLYARSVLVMTDPVGPIELPPKVRSEYERFLIVAPR